MAILENSALYNSLLEKVASFEYGIGSPIRISALEQQFRVSSIPVRECLIRLSGEDFVDFLPGKGFFTKKPSVQSFHCQLNLVGTELVRLIEAVSHHPSEDCHTATCLVFRHFETMLFECRSIADYIKRAQLSSLEIGRLLGNQMMELVIFHPLLRLFPYYLYRKQPNVRAKYLALCDCMATKDLARAREHVHAYNELESQIVPEVCRDIVYSLLTTPKRSLSE